MAWTRSLSSALLGAPPVAATNEADEGEGGEAPQSNYGPLGRQRTSELNRSRVEENQRILAAQLLAYSLPVLGCILILLIWLIIGVVVIYIKGWNVMLNYADKPCDQPLKWWLLLTLLSPVFKALLVWHRRTCSSEPDQPNRLQGLISPALIFAGWFMFSTCETCKKTNPELFQYAKLFLIFEVVSSATTLVMSCCLMSLVLALHRSGLLQVEPGPLSAARPGLIRELETVEFSPALFADGSAEADDKEPPECSICQDEFSAEGVIKKTPCGHYFHETCLGEWLENYGKSCPLCRTDLQEAMENCEAAGP